LKPRAVNEHRPDLRRLPAIIPAFSRQKVISKKATARLKPRAVNERRPDPRRLPAIIPAFSRQKVISKKPLPGSSPGQSMKGVLNQCNCQP
ncbi:MAG: hypothetical protein IKD59_02275, partial [Lachnospiraceae bacterium]|nr:hypothetical protein [Lachnospiraceae bacterium]